jgi:hypothetical protein
MAAILSLYRHGVKGIREWTVATKPPDPAAIDFISGNLSLRSGSRAEIARHSRTRPWVTKVANA